MRKTKKSFGQHFLRDVHVLERIRSEVNEQLRIIEVGPGEGALTRFLPEDITLIEADRDLIDSLQENFPHANILFADAASVNYDEIVGTDAWMLVSNLPYNAAAAILNKAMGASNPPKELVIMVQKEQADRMREQPGDMGLLSVVVQYGYTIKKVCDVSREAFTPKPNVESTVLYFLQQDDVTWSDREGVIQLAKAGFRSRRKQLHKNLQEEGVANSAQVKQLLEQIGLPETARAQELSMAQWSDLYSQLKKEA